MTRREIALKYFDQQREFMNDRVNSGIEQYRKGFASLRFELADGSPVKNMYKIWFSHPSMDGIVCWNLVDGYTHSWDPEDKDGGRLNMNVGENRFGGALLYSDLSPKPAFAALKKLINEEWHTSGIFEADSGGAAMVKGFKGMYDIEFEYNGKACKKQLRIDGRADFPTVIKVG